MAEYVTFTLTCRLLNHKELSEMKKQWDTLESWLKVNDSTLLADLNSPAEDTEIQGLEQKLGVSLPADFVAALKLHNGQKGRAASLFQSGRYLSTGEIFSTWSVWRELLEQGEFDDRPSNPDQGIRQGWWRLGWIPFVSNGRGDYLCLDLDPDQTGQTGQIIEVFHDLEDRSLLSPGFGKWFNGFVEKKCHG